VAVIRALEPVIVLGARSLDGMESHYSVSHGRTWLSKQIDLHDAVSRLPGPVDWITYTHDTSVEALSRPGTRYKSFRLNVSKPSTGGAIGVELIISGPDTPEAHGLWEQMQNRLTAEIRRQDESGWTASPVPVPQSSDRETDQTSVAHRETDQTSVAHRETDHTSVAHRETDQTSVAQPQPSLLRRIVHSPWTIAVVAGLFVTVAGGIILSIILHNNAERPQPPPPTTSTPSGTTPTSNPSPTKASSETPPPPTSAASTSMSSPTLSAVPLAPPEEQVIQAGSSGEFFRREVIVGVGMAFPSWSGLTITTAKLSCTTTNLNVGQAVSVAGKNGDRDDYFRITLLQSARDVSSTVRVEELPLPSWPTGALCPQ
jgi:hypothetical protein